MDIRYYIKHPNGRTKLPAETDEEAIAEFNSHWTASAHWSVNGKRVLIKETREEIAVHAVTKYIRPIQ
jgi:hypothetical protein